jgi:uncharacterized RDD family membrane protein YckC
MATIESGPASVIPPETPPGGRPLWQSERRALHDLAVGTRVISDPGSGA